MGLAIASLCGNHYVAVFRIPRLVALQARYFTILASSVDRDVNIGPVGRN